MVSKTQTSNPEMVEKNCVSVVLIWPRDKCKFRKLDLVKHTLEKVKECAANNGHIVFESESTLEGNQARLDLVFETAKQSRKFNTAVNENKQVLGNVFFRTFLFSEDEMSYKLDPALLETDILQVARDDRVKNIFRHFLTCNVISEDSKILFRFKSLADVNLFLYNKCGAAEKRVLGMIRQTREPLCLLPDTDGMFSLRVQKKELQKNEDCWSWRHLEEKFGFHTKRVDEDMYFQFKNKLDLYTYFASEEAKKCATIEIPTELIRNIEQLNKALSNEILTVEKALISAKVELAKQDKILLSQNRIITELRAEWKRKSGKRQS